MLIIIFESNIFMYYFILQVDWIGTYLILKITIMSKLQ